MKFSWSYCFILCIFILFSCSPRQVTVENLSSYKKSFDTSHSLERADPRMIQWLEKSSLSRQAPDLLHIVAGSSLSWKNPIIRPNKNEFWELSPAWLYLDLWSFDTSSKNTKLGEFFNFHQINFLKNFNINGVYLSQSSRNILNAQFNTRDISFIHDETVTNSYNFEEVFATESEYRQLQRNNFILGGNIIEPALDINEDFLLALYAVRQYPSLFMMTELPQNLWPKFSLAYDNEQNDFQSRSLTQTEYSLLASQQIIPQVFARDGLTQDSSFALTNPITGYDGVQRRWIYRYVKDIYRPLLNFYDPSMRANTLVTASIIKQVGIFQQALVGISLRDLWGQYPVENISQSLNKGKTEEDFTLNMLRAWNSNIHAYGAWSLLRDAFPASYLPSLLTSSTDFVADTLIMPALEQGFINQNTEALVEAIQYGIENNIDFSSLWRGSADLYTRTFLDQSFQFLTSMAMATSIADISIEELKELEKSYHLLGKDDSKLNKKLQYAKDIQRSYLTFAQFLPGLPFLSYNDILARVKAKNSPQGIVNTYTLSTLKEQQHEKTSLLNALRPAWELRQKYVLGSSQIQTVLPTKNKSTLALLLKSFDDNYFILTLNINKKSTSTIASIPSEYTFRKIHDLTSNQSYPLQNNNIELWLKPLEVKLYKVAY